MIPLKVTVEPDTYPLPLTVNVIGPDPAGDDVGEILVIICALAAKGNKPAIASPTANFDAFASNIFLFIGFYPVK